MSSLGCQEVAVVDELLVELASYIQAAAVPLMLML
jgi:hypothetical protein